MIVLVMQNFLAVSSVSFELYELQEQVSLAVSESTVSNSLPISKLSAALSMAEAETALPCTPNHP